MSSRSPRVIHNLAQHAEKLAMMLRIAFLPAIDLARLPERPGLQCLAILVCQRRKSCAGFGQKEFHAITLSICSPNHRMTGTAIEFPSALYRGPSAASFPFFRGISVASSGNPCSRSHSRGVSLLTQTPSVTPPFT